MTMRLKNWQRKKRFSLNSPNQVSKDFCYLIWMRLWSMSRLIKELMMTKIIKWATKTLSLRSSFLFMIRFLEFTLHVQSFHWGHIPKNVYNSPTNSSKLVFLQLAKNGSPIQLSTILRSLTQIILWFNTGTSGNTPVNLVDRSMMMTIRIILWYSWRTWAYFQGLKSI